MVRIMIKGGVWKNTEDEILKVAVMKYGKNQWSRISSLLVRKSAKQCKARWHEWLDPSIKKTEWTREEEEKLLHLAKILPTQWRTIAPIIGRTAAQCLEHYEKLLDAAQERDEDFDAADDPRRLRPGEIDPNPESRAAKPDEVDMNEDEKEMLSEARARLANTKGKKAKRKAREKQLEEARRLASLQKKRELKAAGIELRKFRKKRRREVDYNEEIPFERRPAPGFFDVSKDRTRTIEMKLDPSLYNQVDLRELEGVRRDEEEERERKKDAKRLALHRKSDLPASVMQINKLNDAEMIRRRIALSMPAPQVSDSELHQISKMNLSGPGAAAGGATKTLLASYGQTPQVAAMRTPRTPMSRDNVMEEAQNLIRLTREQTPLKGGESAVLNPSDFSGITPRDRRLTTPSQFAAMTPGRDGSQTPGGRTPGRTPMRSGGETPLRDEMGINATAGGMSAEEVMEAARNSRASKKRAHAATKRLQKGLSSLPKATNEYGLVKPELPADVDEEAILKGDHGDMEEDAEDAADRLAAQAQLMADAALRRRHLPIQRELPRPTKINFGMGRSGAGEDEEVQAVAEELRKELLAMLRYDDYQYPVDGKSRDDSKKRKRKRQKVDPKLPNLPKFDDAELTEARNLVLAEMTANPAPVAGLDDDEDRPSVSAAAIGKAADASVNAYVFVPSLKSYGLVSELSAEDRLQAMEQDFELVREKVVKANKKADKVQQKATILTGGYQQRARAQAREVEESFAVLEGAQSELNSFLHLRETEVKAAPQRIRLLEREVALIEEKANKLQGKYVKLRDEKEALMAMFSTSK
mmetsp:Transcript_162/g.340  ORF Transcript_162/g.340 Transcript_162/m.340 type:complete len:813 (-) Transcript_162:251-2689(-)|eukprot:CAMPEP_0175139052 /NCGR_PEP_ID=MMETSP0087-20121206/10683_1 /TAXON_ID=136419 /ORGANISM="Unknown Unknown, Strain D1" /LENGTH=812 /DNA_ID=CAMNT_0016422009 /DNA_START=88 /DNA_END=2526 /DNA_ORIENTATION=+